MGIKQVHLKVSLVLIALVLVLTTVNAGFDENSSGSVGILGGVDVNVIKPTFDGFHVDANYISDNVAGGKVFIDFNYFDANMSTGFDTDALATYTLDVNIYYSITYLDNNNLTYLGYNDGNKYQFAIVTDHNLLSLTDANRTMGADSNTYTWVWDTSLYTLPDGNYTIDINVFNNSYDLNQNPLDSNMDTNSWGLSIVIDNTNPTTRWGADSNTSWSSYDQNIVLTCDDNAAGCKGAIRYRLDTDSSSTVSYGAWQDFDTNIYITVDGNYAIDFNSTDYANNVGDTNTFYLLIDKTNPIIGITSPNTSTSTNYTLRYSASDTNNGVLTEYYVSEDGSTWLSNGTLTSYTFNIGAGTPLPTTKTYYVKVRDAADNNSSTESVTVNFSSSGPGGSQTYCGDGGCNGSETSASCPSDCAAVCGDGACTREESVATCPADCGPGIVCGNGICEEGETPGNCSEDCQPRGQIIKEVVLSRTKAGKPTAEDIRNILTAAGASENAIEKASAAVGKTNVERKADVTKETDEEGTETFYTTIAIKVSNTSSEKLKNIKVVELIPKSVEENASKIISRHRIRVLVADPVIEFTIDELEVGETAEVAYIVGSQLSESDLDEYLLPVVSSVTVEEGLSCADINCNDDNPCTTDSCSNGQCSYTPVADGTSCGFGKECRSGNCVAEAGPLPLPPEPEPTADFTLPIIIIVMLVIVGAFYYYKKNK